MCEAPAVSFTILTSLAATRFARPKQSNSNVGTFAICAHAGIYVATCHEFALANTEVMHSQIRSVLTTSLAAQHLTFHPGKKDHASWRLPPGACRDFPNLMIAEAMCNLRRATPRNHAPGSQRSSKSYLRLPLSQPYSNRGTCTAGGTRLSTVNPSNRQTLPTSSIIPLTGQARGRKTFLAQRLVSVFPMSMLTGTQVTTVNRFGCGRLRFMALLGRAWPLKCF